MDEDAAIDHLIRDICEQALHDYRRGPTRANRQHYTTALAFFEALGLRAQIDWRLERQQRLSGAGEQLVQHIHPVSVAMDQPARNTTPRDQLTLWTEREAVLISV